jgi:hypothetical protein
MAATRAAPGDMVACNTVGEFVRFTIGAGLREPSGRSGAADSDSASLGSNPSPPANLSNHLAFVPGLG